MGQGMANEKPFSHDELVADLAGHLRSLGNRIVWEDMQLGPQGSARPDCYVIPCTFTKFQPVSYECKVSVSDFRRDVTEGKWQKYLEFSSGVYFAVPHGLIQKLDVPRECGLIVRYDTGWRCVKKPVLKSMDSLPTEVWLKLVIDGIRRQKDRKHEPRSVSYWKTEETIRKNYGDEIAVALSDRNGALSRLQFEKQSLERELEKTRETRTKLIEESRERSNKILGEAREFVTHMARVAGLPDDAKLFQVTSALRKMLDRVDENAEIKRLKRDLMDIQETVERALKPTTLITGTGEDHEEGN